MSPFVAGLAATIELISSIAMSQLRGDRWAATPVRPSSVQHRLGTLADAGVGKRFLTWPCGHDREPRSAGSDVVACGR